MLYISGGRSSSCTVVDLEYLSEDNHQHRIEPMRPVGTIYFSRSCVQNCFTMFVFTVQCEVEAMLVNEMFPRHWFRHEISLFVSSRVPPIKATKLPRYLTLVAPPASQRCGRHSCPSHSLPLRLMHSFASLARSLQLRARIHSLTPVLSLPIFIRSSVAARLTLTCPTRQICRVLPAVPVASRRTSPTIGPPPYTSSPPSMAPSSELIKSLDH